MEAITDEGTRLQFATEELRRDGEIVQQASAKSHSALEHVPRELCGDRDFMAEIVAVNFRALELASHELRGDRELVARAVGQDGRALRYASAELRGDRPLVLRAVMQNSRAFQYATEELRSDRDFVLQVMEMDRSALMYAAEEIRTDRMVWLYNGKDPAADKAEEEEAERRPLDAARRCGVDTAMDKDMLLWLESEPVKEPLFDKNVDDEPEAGPGISAPLFVPPQRQGESES